MKKYVVLLLSSLLLVMAVSGAWADVNLHLYTAHWSIAEITGGKSDYSEARFLKFDVNALDFDFITSSKDAYLKGSMTLSGGNYSFLDSKSVMRKISGTPHTFEFGSLYGVNSLMHYGPLTASGEETVFCLSADNGLNGVNVSWNFPDMPSYNGQGTIPNYRTTQEQLDSIVPYIEYIYEGSNVKGLKWRVVNPADTSKPLPQDFDMYFQVEAVYSAEGWADGVTLYNPGSWDGSTLTHIPAGSIPQGTVSFDHPINADEIFIIQTTHCYGDTGYKWYFRKPSEPNPYLWKNHLNRASLINGKSDYSDGKFFALALYVNVDNILTEAKHFTNEGRMTIPGGGYSLRDDDKGEELGVTVPAGTDREYVLGVDDGNYILDTFIDYQPTDDNGTSLTFSGGAETGLNGRTVTWTFPAGLNLDGSGVIPNFKSTAEQLASGVPYVEIVSRDNGNVTVNYRIVTPSDTSTAIAPSYRTDFRIYIDWKDGGYWNSGWLYNKASGAWDTGIAFSLDDVRRIRARVRSYENSANNPAVYQWNFYPLQHKITTTSLPSGVVGKSYNTTLKANPSGAVWSISSGKLPTGLKLNAKTGKITGTPTKKGTFKFTLKATGSNGTYDTKAYTVKVTQTTVTATIPATIVRGVSYTWIPKASGGTSAYTWSISSGALPTGMKINASTGEITGKPTKAGTSTFTVKALDKNKIAGTKAFTVKVTQTTVKATIPATIVRGVSYTWTPKASGGTSAYTWSISSGALPTGMKINASTGKITGKPTKAGTSKFTIKAVDKNKIAGTKAFTVKVTQTTLDVLMSNFTPKGYTFYGYVAVSGGTPNYTWSISSGKLPTGLKLKSSGALATITGKPTEIGTFTFTVKAVDKNKIAATAKISVTVVDIASLAQTAGKSAKTAEPSSSKTTEQKSSSSSKSSVQTAPLDLSTGGNTDVNIRATLSVTSDDVVESYEGKDIDMVKVKANKPVTFIIGEWSEDVDDVVVCVDDKAVEGVTVKENRFTLPAEMVHDDFKVSAKSGELESEEVFIISE